MNKIKAWWKNFWRTKKDREKIKKLQRYYTLLRQGAEFIMFVKKDLKKQEDQLNRHQRRRMEKSLKHGEISEELIIHYRKNLDSLLARYDAYLNPPKAGKVTIKPELKKAMEKK